MRKIVAATYLSLDGVMEDPSWTAPYWNEELAAVQHRLLFESDALLLGRLTYQGFAQAWPSMTDADGFADRMNSLPKYVATTTLSQLEWNASVVRGDVTEEVQRLKQAPGQNILLYASGTLVRSLLSSGLIDEYRLMVHPMVLGHGKRLFEEGSEVKLRLKGVQTTSTGVAVMTYGTEQA
jgi:dihydrofolate reductase